MKTSMLRRISSLAAVLVLMILCAGNASAMGEMKRAGSMASDCAMAGNDDGMSRTCTPSDGGMSKSDDTMPDQSTDQEGRMMQRNDRASAGPVFGRASRS